MKRHFSVSGVVLGMLAAALAGCGGEDGANEPQQAKSAITSRGFLVNGCQGTGIFDISSSNFINFVALDQSSFSNMNAQLYALDQNNTETLIAQNQNMNQIDQSMQSMLDQVSNFTSAFQRASQLAAQRASSQSNAYANTLVTSDDIATTATTTSHASDAVNRQFTRSSAAGFNNQQSSNDANTWANAANNASSFNAANSALNNAASQGASNLANTAQNSGVASSAFNDANTGAWSNAFNGAFSNVATAGPTGAVGWGWGGFGWGPVSNLSSFSNNSVFSNQNTSLYNNQRAAANQSAYSNLRDNQFSNVFNNAQANSFNSVASADRSSSQANIHDDQRSQNSYALSDMTDVTTAQSNRLATADRATTANHLANATTSVANQAANSNSLLASDNIANQAAGSQSSSAARSQAMNQQYHAMTNLNQYRARNLVLKVNVTANSESAIVRVFTGNNANTVAANQDFAQTFAGCGVGGVGAIAPVVPVGGVPIIAPADGADLGDHVAVKPE